MAEQIIPEKDIGKSVFYRQLQAALYHELAQLCRLPEDVLLAQRYERFRRIGRWDEEA